jgi:hypothetical protein
MEQWAKAIINTLLVLTIVFACFALAFLEALSSPAPRTRIDLTPPMLALLLILAFALPAFAFGQEYKFRGITSSKEELGIAFPIKGDFSGQIDTQIFTQGGYTDVDANPFHYLQYVHIRPYIHYNGFRNIQLSFSPSIRWKYPVPVTNGSGNTEIRLAGLAKFIEPRSFGSVYQQFRVELRNIRDDSGNWSHTPRFRFRVGQNFNVRGDSPKKFHFNSYQEILIKYQKGAKAFDSAQFYFGYGFNPKPAISLSMGVLTEMQLKSSGTDVDVFFGPSISVRYTFGKSRKNMPEAEPNDGN